MTPTPLPYFGRAWQVKIKSQNGKTYTLSSTQSESLRVTFEIDTYMVLTAYWPATLTIFNLSQPITQGIDVEALAADRPIFLGDEVLICAGYQNSAAGLFNPQANVVYLGRVLQPIWTRENVVDFKLKLKLVTNLLQDAFNLASFTLTTGPGASTVTDLDVVNQICASGPFTTPIPIDTIDDGAKQKLGANGHSRAVTCHGRPLEAIATIAKQHQLFSWVGPNGLNMRAFDPADPKNKTPSVWFGPPLASPNTTAPNTQNVIKRTLIGTPQQMQRGVLFRVLLDSTVQVGSVVGITHDTLVQPFEFQQGVSRPAFPNSSGVYVVVGVRHVGDTRGRGDDWYTEITGVSLSYFPPWFAAQDPNIQTQPGTK